MCIPVWEKKNHMNNIIHQELISNKGCCCFTAGTFSSVHRKINILLEIKLFCLQMFVKMNYKQAHHSSQNIFPCITLKLSLLNHILKLSIMCQLPTIYVFAASKNGKLYAMHTCRDENYTYMFHPLCAGGC